MTFQEACEWLTNIIVGDKKKVAVKRKRKVKRAVRKKRK